MRRRRGRMHSLQQTMGTRTTLGGQFALGIDTINTLNNRVVAATCPVEHSGSDIISWLFSEDTIKSLTKAYPMSMPAYRHVSYDIPGVDGVSLDLQFDNMKPRLNMLVPRPEMVEPNDGLAAFIKSVNEIGAVYRAYSVVTHVMTWLDANATPGAIRHYFPTMMNLVPNCEALESIAVGSRFVEPDGLAPMLPFIREAAATVASATLLPTITENVSSRGMALCFTPGRITLNGIEMQPPSHTYTI